MGMEMGMGMETDRDCNQILWRLIPVKADWRGQIADVVFFRVPACVPHTNLHEDSRFGEHVSIRHKKVII